MSYEPITWENGDIITAEKLNSGINANTLVVRVSVTEDGTWLVYQLDTPFNKIKQAAENNMLIRLVKNWDIRKPDDNEEWFTYQCIDYGDIHEVGKRIGYSQDEYYYAQGGGMLFKADNLTDYPVYRENQD